MDYICRVQLALGMSLRELNGAGCRGSVGHFGTLRFLADHKQRRVGIQIQLKALPIQMHVKMIYRIPVGSRVLSLSSMQAHINSPYSQ
jgi:hypothetical protein